MTNIDLYEGHAAFAPRSRRETRPALTTIIFIMIAVTIIVDIVRRRRRAAPLPASELH
jgi:hypothetical protein